VSIPAYEGIVQSGLIRLRGNVTLPENTRVYVIIPDLDGGPRKRVYSPRLARPHEAGDFAKQVIEVPADADL